MATVFWFLLAIGILVTFHEFGHFYVARRCGVKVLRFSIGFGQPLFMWKDRHGTEFVLAAIPLGGFVKMLDEREGEVPAAELPMAFTQKTVWQRMAIVIAGPVANFILAVVFYAILALIGIKGIAPVVGNVIPDSLADKAGLQSGDEITSIDGRQTLTWTSVIESLTKRIGDTGSIAFSVKPFSGEQSNTYSASTKMVDVEGWLGDRERPDLLTELGLEPSRPATDWIINQVVSNSAAESAGIIIGDELIAADGSDLTSWYEWVQYVRERPNETIELDISRDGQILSLLLTPREVEDNGQVQGRAGIAVSVEWPEGMSRSIDYSLIEAVTYGFTKTWDQALIVLSFLKKLILFDVSFKNMGGTFTIAEVAGDTAALGVTYYLSFLAFFSVSLGVFNLLPIPVLDGGHLLFYIIEAIKGKPLPEKIQLLGYQLGLFIVVSVMLIAHFNDLTRILS